jgi:hypothetical protein
VSVEDRWGLGKKKKFVQEKYVGTKTVGLFIDKKSLSLSITFNKKEMKKTSSR